MNPFTSEQHFNKMQGQEESYHDQVKHFLNYFPSFKKDLSNREIALLIEYYSKEKERLTSKLNKQKLSDFSFKFSRYEISLIEVDEAISFCLKELIERFSFV